MFAMAARVLGPCLVVQYLRVVHVLVLCNHLAEEKGAGCLTLIVFLLSCECYL